MKRFYVAVSLGILALLGLAWWKNSFSYPTRTPKWRAVKSVVDTTLVVLAALCYPPLLVSWIVVWLIRSVRRPGIQITLSVLIGIALGTISGYVLEALCVLAIFSVDLLTGDAGLWGWFTNPIPKTFMPKWQEDSHGQDCGSFAATRE